MDNQEHEGSPPEAPQPPPRRFLNPTILKIIVVVACLPVALSGWFDILTNFMEHTPPDVQIDCPRGIGVTPVSAKITMKDTGSGLDQAVVRLHQRGNVRELAHKSFGGKLSGEITVNLNAKDIELEEGQATLEIRVYDRSFWHNALEANIPLSVDFQKPKVEVVSSQSTIKPGGVDLIFYRAFDEDLTISGIKVGNMTFEGFPLRKLDEDFDDPSFSSLFVVLYALDIEQKTAPEVRIFAEDRVGNASSISITPTVVPAPMETVKVELTDDFLRDRVSELADINHDRLVQFKGISPIEKGEKGSIERLLQKFRLVNEGLRELNNTEVLSVLNVVRDERLWVGPFAKPAGTVESSFGTQEIYTYQGQEIGRWIQRGTVIVPPRQQAEVSAANDGIVIFSENKGVYGRTLGIDHGLGVVSLYGHLNNVTVNKGDLVRRGQEIGFAGRTGLAKSVALYFEMRVHGVPVDPREWWDVGQYAGHIGARINEIRRLMKIPVYVPIP